MRGVLHAGRQADFRFVAEQPPRLVDADGALGCIQVEKMSLGQELRRPVSAVRRQQAALLVESLGPSFAALAEPWVDEAAKRLTQRAQRALIQQAPGREKRRQSSRAPAAAYLLIGCQADGGVPPERLFVGAIEIQPCRMLGTGDEKSLADRFVAPCGEHECADQIIHMDRVAYPVPRRGQDQDAVGQHIDRALGPMPAERTIDDAGLDDGRRQALLPRHAQDFALGGQLVVAGPLPGRALLRQRGVRKRLIDGQGADMHQTPNAGSKAGGANPPGGLFVGCERLGVPRQVKQGVATFDQRVCRAGGSLGVRHVEMAQFNPFGRKASQAGGPLEVANSGADMRPFFKDQLLDQPSADEARRAGDQHAPAVQRSIASGLRRAAPRLRQRAAIAVAALHQADDRRGGSAGDERLAAGPNGAQPVGQLPLEHVRDQVFPGHRSAAAPVELEADEVAGLGAKDGVAMQRHFDLAAAAD